MQSLHSSPGSSALNFTLGNSGDPRHRSGLAWLRQLPRPTVPVETLLLAAAVYLLVACNIPFWRAALAGRDLLAPSSWGFAAAVLAVLTGGYFAALGLVATRWTVRPLLALLLVGAAAAAYYMERYAIYFDRAMLRNVLATHYDEARELLGWPMLAHVVLFGVLPAALLWWPRLRSRPPLHAVAWRAGCIAVALLVAAASLLAVFADLASLLRNQKEVRHLITPANIVAAAAANTLGKARQRGGPKLAVAPDARLGDSWQAHARPALFVLVVGETARAQNFSLNGYERPTNPQLAQRGVLNFPQTTSCGTSTEVSLPCMFSPFGRRHYDETKILGHESLLHVLARAGFQVVWRDNQSGCKGVCDGLPQQALDHASVEGLCPEGQCFDEVLLHGLEGIAADAHGNLFVVMHQLGSHGPAYFKRYPAAFKRFAPACENEDLRHCSAEEIRNAYDNSLLYTDHVLGRVIDFLAQAQKRYDTAMLYVSDHGESLGENGLYLHGMPYAIAPRQQTQVPMLAWLSPAFQRSFGVDAGCLAGQAAQPVSHDHLFHSLLGLLDVQTVAYESAMDVFRPCRLKSPVPQAGPKTAP